MRAENEVYRKRALWSSFSPSRSNIIMCAVLSTAPTRSLTTTCVYSPMSGLWCPARRCADKYLHNVRRASESPTSPMIPLIPAWYAHTKPSRESSQTSKCEMAWQLYKKLKSLSLNARQLSPNFDHDFQCYSATPNNTQYLGCSPGHSPVWSADVMLR